MKKGALVQLVSGLGAPVPNVVIFQFNPESVQHNWSHGTATASAAVPSGSHPLAVSGTPSESFSFTLAMDVDDRLAPLGPSVPSAGLPVGVYPRLAALELFMHPTPIEDFLGTSTRTTPAALLPTVLFVWGRWRMVPVRVTGLTITEKLYDADLNPTHAEAQIALSVVTDDDLRALKGVTFDLARAAYKYSQGRRLTFAAQNLADPGFIDSVLETITSPIP